MTAGRSIAIAIAMYAVNFALSATAFFLVSNIGVGEYFLYSLPFLAVGVYASKAQNQYLLGANIVASYVAASILWGWAFWAGLLVSSLIALPLSYLTTKVVTAALEEQTKSLTA